MLGYARCAVTGNKNVGQLGETLLIFRPAQEIETIIIDLAEGGPLKTNSVGVNHAARERGKLNGQSNINIKIICSVPGTRKATAQSGGE